LGLLAEREKRFRLRHLLNVNIEGVMGAAGQNLKRLVKHHLERLFLFLNPLLNVRSPY
jgi:hypothetical protein